MMARRTTVPPAAGAAAPARYRVLMTLERLDGGFHHTGDVIGAAQVRPESLLILLERGVLMFHIDEAQIAALPELD